MDNAGVEAGAEKVRHTYDRHLSERGEQEGPISKLWSLRGVVGTGLNDPMPESEARDLQRLYAYKTAYLVSSVDAFNWNMEPNE